MAAWQEMQKPIQQQQQGNGGTVTTAPKSPQKLSTVQIKLPSKDRESSARQSAPKTIHLSSLAEKKLPPMINEAATGLAKVKKKTK